MLSHSFLYNGLTFNHTLTYPCIVAEEIEGFSSPDVEHEEERYQGLHGLDDFYSFLGGRIITMRLRVVGRTEDECLEKLAEFTQACRLPGVPSTSNTGYSQLRFWKGAGQVKFLNAKVHKLTKIEKDKHIHNARWITVQFRCADPRIYALDENGQDVDKSFILGTFPTFFPHPFPGDGSIQNQETIENVGNFTSAPRIVIHGPCTHPYVKNVTWNYQQLFETTLAEGETITIRLSGQQIVATYDDGSDAMPDEADGSLFPWVEPGENTFEYGNSSGSGYAEVFWRDAWTSAPA